MNTKEFTNLVKEKGEFENNKKAQEAIKAVVDALTEVLSKKNDVSLASFGIFTTTLQKGRTGKIPGTDRTYTTEDKYVPKFKAGKALKEIVEKA